MTVSFHSLAQIKDSIVIADQKNQIQHKYGLDPATALPTRVRETPVSVIKMFEDEGMSPRQHQLSPAERLEVEKAFAALPPLHGLATRSPGRVHIYAEFDFFDQQ